jgi:hypothetical protein
MSSTTTPFVIAAPLKAKLFASTIGLGLIALIAGCGTLKYDVRGSRDPGADLHISAEVKKDQGHTKLEFKAENLSPPERIVPGAQNYVIWARRNADQQWTRLGALDYSQGSRKGKFEATYADIKFELVITAEKGNHPPTPSTDVLFAQRVQK